VPGCQAAQSTLAPKVLILPLPEISYSIWSDLPDRALSLSRVCVCVTVRRWENDATRGYLSLLIYLGRQDGLQAVLPCCSATMTGSISMVYLNNDGMVIKEDVRDMVVLKCGCA